MTVRTGIREEKNMKRKLWMIPVLTALIAIFFCGTAAADTGGTCGSGLNWTLTDSGILTVSGTGAMTDYIDYDDVPWAGLRENIESVVIGDGVTYIGSCAFYECDGITSVIIPYNVTKIGYLAFAYCTRLTEATVLNRETEIGNSEHDVFFRCAFGFTMKGFTGSTAESYANNAGHSFANPKCGTDVSFDLSDYGELTVSGTGPMQDYDYSQDPSKYSPAPWYSWRQDIESIVVEDGVTRIGNFAFYGCSELDFVTIGDGVTGIGNYAFYECGDLRNLTIPRNVAKIEFCAFENCSKLRNVRIYNPRAQIGDSDYDVFLSCGSSLVLYGWPDSTAATYAAEADITFKSLGSLSGQCGDEVHYEIDPVTATVNITGSGPMWNYTDASGLVSPMNGNDAVSSAVIGSGVTSIGNYMFCNCFTLESVTIPNSVTSIGTGAFHGCNSLGSVTIPNGVAGIGASAFYECSGLTGVTIPNSVTSIGEKAFYQCSSLGSVTIPNSVTSIGASTFFNCSGLTGVTIPNSVTSIGDFAFSNCSSLTGVTIPNSVTSIGDEAFLWCSRLTSIQVGSGNAAYSSAGGVLYNKQKTVLITYPCGKTGSFTIPDSVTSIGESAFYSCINLTGVTIPNSVTSIGDFAFVNCNSLTGVTIPNSVTGIGDSAFYSCISLTGVTIPNSVTSISSEAFRNCIGLTGITIPNSVTSIGSEAFRNCTGLTGITIPNSVTSIGSEAFRSCTGLTVISIPKNVTSIGDYAFNDCSSLAIATIHNAKTVFGRNVFKYSSAGFKICGHSGSTAQSYAGANGHNFQEIIEMGTPDFTMPAGLTRIETEAFSGARMTIVYIPDSVTFLGSQAFANCTRLRQIRIPATITTIPPDAFLNIIRSNLTIFGVPGSAAESFANTAGIKFEIE